MVRARAPTKQGLGGPCRRRRRRTATGWRLDGDEALPLQALEHRKRRRQWFTALAVVPAPVRDRRLDGGDQETRPLGWAGTSTWRTMPLAQMPQNSRGPIPAWIPRHK